MRDEKMVLCLEVVHLIHKALGQKPQGWTEPRSSPRVAGHLPGAPGRPQPALVNCTTTC